MENEIKNLERNVEISSESKASATFAIIAFVCSIAGFATGMIGIGLILDVVAIVLAIISLAKKEDKQGFAIAGIIIGAVSFTLALVFWIGMIAFWDTVTVDDEENMRNINRNLLVKEEVVDDEYDDDFENKIHVNLGNFDVFFRDLEFFEYRDEESGALRQVVSLKTEVLNKSDKTKDLSSIYAYIEDYNGRDVGNRDFSLLEALYGSLFDKKLESCDMDSGYLFFDYTGDGEYRLELGECTGVVEQEVFIDVVWED